MKNRASGVLLHITSLPSRFGIGDIGPGAYKFADFLHEAKQSYWQMLPVNPPTPGTNSPYNCLSAFAGNVMLISPELLFEQGLLGKDDIDRAVFDIDRVDYDKVTKLKNALLDKAFDKFCSQDTPDDYKRFCTENFDWLDDFAAFVALERHLKKGSWNQWPRKYRDRLAPEKWDQDDIRHAIDREKFLQYTFFQQWQRLKDYCHDKGVNLVGDIPMYVAYDSADVWAHPEIFKLDTSKKVTHISGVPPDLFSDTGQLWGNPIYEWEKLAEDDFGWWIRRISQNLKLFDMVRIDHFRGLVAYWQVAAGDETAVNGEWIDGPGDEFFNILFKRFPFAAFIAEDLGYITADVRECIAKYDFPGMKVLLFAFGGELTKNTYILHNHTKNSVVYTGTHDNNTVRGWFEELDSEQKENLFKYVGRDIAADEVAQVLVRLAMSSVADLAIIPMQDLLGLGAEARMNRPATNGGNWRWRLRGDQITEELTEDLVELTAIYGRS